MKVSEQILRDENAKLAQALAVAKTEPHRRRLPDVRNSITRKFKIPRPGHPSGDLKMYVVVGLYEDGSPGEVFIKADRTGSMASGALDAVAMSLSMAWQYGVPFTPSVEKLVGLRFEPQGATGDKAYPIVNSPLDYVARWLRDRFGKPAEDGIPLGSMTASIQVEIPPYRSPFRKKG